MSTSHEIELECPHCGHKQIATLWGSINVTLHPHLKEDFFKGQLNVFDCEKCKVQTPIVCGFMYNDMQRKILVQYQPPQEMEDEEFLNLFAPNGTVILPDELARIPEVQEYMTRPHVVFDMEELRRYVLFRELLHERGGPADSGSGESGADHESPN
jgi:hypothetical protein